MKIMREDAQKIGQANNSGRLIRTGNATVGCTCVADSRMYHGSANSPSGQTHAVMRQTQGTVYKTNSAQQKAKKRKRRKKRLCFLLLLILLLAALAAAAGLLKIKRGRLAKPARQYVVELQYQEPELPNGCEITSLAMVLTASGSPADKLDLSRQCLACRPFYFEGEQRFGADPEEYYVGDPESKKGGWYCFENPIVQAGNAWLYSAHSDKQAKSVTGLSEQELKKYAKAGTPLVVWVTQHYETPRKSSFNWQLEDGELYSPYANLHCVVLAGMEKGCYKIANPLAGWETVEPDVFWACFDAMGRRAVIVE